jgi:hypothetical protein
MLSDAASKYAGRVGRRLFCALFKKNLGRAGAPKARGEQMKTIPTRGAAGTAELEKEKLENLYLQEGGLGPGKCSRYYLTRSGPNRYDAPWMLSAKTYHLRDFEFELSPSGPSYRPGFNMFAIC